MWAKTRLGIYDPSPLNPYGMELAAQLHSLGGDVRWFTTDDSIAPSDLVTMPVLGGATNGRVLCNATLRRLTGPLRFLVSCLGGRVAIVVWTRDPWDVFVVLLLTLRRSRPYVIYHNPRQVRPPRGGLYGALERRALRRANVCVHSSELATFAAEDYDRIHVTPHPHFTVTSRSAPARNPEARTVVFFGGLRQDKGASELHVVLVESGGDFIFRTVGRGKLTDSQQAELAAVKIKYEPLGVASAVSTEELLRQLSLATVVIAPYTEPTESSTALLAMAVGAPMIGLARGALKRVLTASSTAPDAQALAQLLVAFLDEPWETWRVTPEDQSAASISGWERALGV